MKKKVLMKRKECRDCLFDEMVFKMEPSSNVINKKLNSKELLISFSLFLIFVFGILILTGTINSGIHLIDDHEFYTIGNILQEHGFRNGLIQSMRNDYAIRFRPFYSFTRTIGVYLFATNTVLWSICKGIEISISMFFFYVFARLMNTNQFFSALFSLLILLGEQSAIWWRLGPQESLGIMLFSAAMLSTYYLSKKRNALSVFIFILILAILSLQKETFCISMPGFFILLLALECFWSSKKESWKTILWEFCKKHSIEIILLAVIFFTEIYIIVFDTGLDTLGHAGFHSDMTIVNYIMGIYASYTYGCLPYAPLIVIAAALLVKSTMKRGVFSKGEICEMLFVIFLFAPQQISYAKTTMHERYLIPWVVSVFYLIIIIGCRMIGSNKRLKISMGCILFLFTGFFFSRAVISANDFAQKGRDLQQCIEYVVDHTEEDDSMIAISGGEPDVAFNIIFKYEYSYQDCGILADYEDNLVEVGTADILIGETGQLYSILDEAKLSLDDYTVFQTANYEVGIKGRR